MPDFAALAKHITFTRDGFANLYNPLAKRAGGFEFMVLVMLEGGPQAAADDQTAFELAFKAAHDAGFLADLSHVLIESGATEPSVETRALAVQAIADKNRQFLDADQVNQHTLAALRQVCIIEVEDDGDTIQGTGFLIGLQTVLTCWHVLSTEVSPDGVIKDGAHKRIKVLFDQYKGARRSIIAGHNEYCPVEQFLTDFSPCHPDEIPGPDGAKGLVSIVDAKDKLDYAVIRLDGSPGAERGFQNLSDQDPSPGNLMLFQHPKGKTIKVDIADDHGFEDAEHPYRYMHRANAEPGSSGGLLLDAKFRPVGLHQSGLTPEGGPVFNRAIPARLIRADLSGEHLSVDRTLEPLQQLSDKHPLFGRESIQRKFWQVAMGRKHILRIQARRKRGKSFCIRILRDLMPPDTHAIIELEAAKMPAGAFELGTEILRKIDKDIDATTLPKPKESTTASAAWLDNQFYPRFIELLRKAANNRVIWLVIDGLEHHELPDGANRRFLEVIYENAVSEPMLRVVLVGLKSMEVPGVERQMVEAITDSDLEVSELDFENYLSRRLIAQNVQASPEELTRLSTIMRSASEPVDDQTRVIKAADFTQTYLMAPLGLGDGGDE